MKNPDTRPQFVARIYGQSYGPDISSKSPRVIPMPDLEARPDTKERKFSRRLTNLAFNAMFVLNILGGMTWIVNNTIQADGDAPLEAAPYIVGAVLVLDALYVLSLAAYARHLHSLDQHQQI